MRPGASSTEPSAIVTKGSGQAWKLLIGVGIIAVLVAVSLIFFKPEPTPLENAVALIKSNRHAAALPILEEIARKQPENHDIFPWLAEGYLRTDRLAEGRTALDTSLKLKLPCDVTVPVILSYSTYYESKNDYSEAEKLFESAQGVCPEPELLVGKANLYMHWSQFEADQGQIINALDHIQKAYQLLPESEPIRAAIPHRASELYRQVAAMAETDEKDDQKAIRLLEQSLQMSDEPATRMSLGNIFQRLGNKPKAIEHYQAVARADANNLEARHRLIDLYLETDNVPGAQQALLELTEREKSIENFDLLANLSLKIGNYAVAVRALEDAIVLRPKDMPLLTKLEKALLEWNTQLIKQGKTEESASVKGHAERVAQLIKDIQEEDEKNRKIADKAADTAPLGPGVPPVSLIASRIWLAKGSLTPEGEIRLKNISGAPVTDLALTVVFYDNTTRKKNGSVTVPLASESYPIQPGATKTMYFSSPNIFRREHQLAVIIFWNNRLLRELPVVKER